MRSERIDTDVVVVGGGLAGVCAAIAAARLGKSVALVQNRPVLGGNSSSEVRVWICGATAQGRHRFARENGIIGELLVENQYRNPEGNPYYWDLVVLDAVRAEPNIRLFLNTDVHEVVATGPEDARSVESVTGWMTGSERTIEFRGRTVLDCTGDGLVGHLAGARYRVGRESRDEYGEAWAPTVADDVTLGSTMLFYSKDVGRPVPYVPPSFAVDISRTNILKNRIVSTERDGCFNWWIEWGGELDSVHDNERIRDELWGVIYGIWDHIKNSGEHDADNLTLEWVASVPGKREYRRFVGDHTVTQDDILEQTDFPDRVAYGGWSIDLHPVGGVYADEPGAKHWLSDGNYHIPFRSLYSANVENLLVAGRDISASHVAFGTTRVMATCAAVGEAAGTAAALCTDQGLTPRELGRTRMTDLQRTILRNDGPVLGLAYDDADDLVGQAAVTASSTLTSLAVDKGEARRTLTSDLGVVVPVDPALDGISLLVEASEPTRLTVTAHDTGRGQNYVPHTEVASVTVPVEDGEATWVRVPLAWSPGEPRNAFVTVERNPAVTVHLAGETHPGMLAFERVVLDPDPGYPQPVREWRELKEQVPCVRLAGETRAFAPEKVRGGLARPFDGPQMWVSEPLATGPARLELRWPGPVTLDELQLIFDVDLNEDLNNLHRTRTPFRVMPSLVRDYRLEAEVDGRWVPLADERDNRWRRRVHTLEDAVTTDRVRLLVDRTNGAPRAHVVSVRAYRNEG